MNVLDSFSLKGKIALLTGGAGLYGRQILAALAEAGATTCIASRKLEELESVAREENARGLDIHAYTFDQGDESTIAALRDRILGDYGRVDILVNNAVLRCAKNWECRAEDFDRSMHVNATGLFLVTRAFGDVMIRQKSGSIINISSIMGMIGVESSNYSGTPMEGSWNPDYFFHKGGMINFTRQCASYYGRYGIRVNCISPGGLEISEMDPRFVAQYSERTQLGRMAGSHDLKGGIVFLASDASSYVTGVNLPIDGGYTAK